MSTEQQTTDEALDRWAADHRRREEWLAGLKAGNEVAIWDGWNHRLAKIDRVTATQFVIGTSKYRRLTGREISSSRWDSGSLEEPTQELKSQIEGKKERATLLSKIDKAQFRNLDLPKLRKIVEVIEQ